MAETALKAGDLPPDTVIFDASDSEATDAEIEENEQLNNLLADLGEMDNVKVHVYRCGKGNATTWVDSFAPSEMDIETLMVGLRDNYGGGKFKIQVRQKGAIRKAKIIDIEPVPEKPVLDQAQIVRELKAEQQKEQGGMAEVFARMMEANQQSQQHQADQQRQFMESMVQALAGRNDNQSQPSMQETIMAVAELHKLSAPPKASDPTEMILKCVELVSAIRGDGDGEANIYSVLSKALGSFGGTLQQAMATAGAAPMPGQFPVPGQPQAQLAAPDEQSEQQPGLQPGKPTLAPDHPLAPFEPYVDYMLTLAEKNANPELYAEVIVDQLGPEIAYAWLATQDGLDTLARELPKVQPHMNWFMVVGRAVDELTREDDNPDDKSHQDGDVRTGHDSPATATNDAPIDGTAERIGGDQDDAAANVEVGDASKNDSSDS